MERDELEQKRAFDRLEEEEGSSIVGSKSSVRKIKKYSSVL
jgi:hypothetical protein